MIRRATAGISPSLQQRLVSHSFDVRADLTSLLGQLFGT